MEANHKPSAQRPWSLFVGVGLTSLAILLLELTLTRLFSATMYYHFAFLAISLALFGSGASGVALYLTQRRLSASPTWRLMAIAGSIFAVTIVVTLLVVLRNPLPLEISGGTFARLALIYAATALPFFFGGCVITLAITRHAEQISLLYLFDLAGAAGGCILLIPLLDRLGAIDTVLLVALIAAVAAAILGGSGAGARGVMAPAGLAVTLAALLAWNVIGGAIDFREVKGLKQENLLFAKWNSFSRVTVEGKLAAPALILRIDADAATMIIKQASDRRLHAEGVNNITALPYRIRPGADVLIIGPGGGFDVAIARVAGARRITAVEVNPIIAEDVMSSEPFKSYSGSIYQQPEVQLVVDEGRSFIRGSRERYDVIQATMVDTWAATAAGAFALTENNLYTVEAFRDYAEHLTDDGLLTMTRWYFEPPDQLLRLISLTRAMMAEIGLNDAADHIMVILQKPEEQGRVIATFMFKKSPFTDDEVRQIEQICEAQGFHPLYTPGYRPDNPFTRLITADDPSSVWDGFETNIAPTYDNNPFYFSSLRLANLTRGIGGVEEWKKTNLGTLVLFVLLGLTTLMVALFIIGPLAIGGRRALAERTGSKLRYLAYFACLGFGFILVEIVMIQRFILFLGHPVYALAVVLFAILIFSALGSFLSGRIGADRLRTVLPRLLIGLGLGSLFYTVLLPPVLYGTVHLDRPLRILLTVLIVAPLALLMGMPMPMGIRMLAARMPGILPWAWGLNGATSVMGTVFSLVLALLLGFHQTMIVGAAAYLLAALFVPRSKTA